MKKIDTKELEDWLLNDLDGRLYWQDLLERVVQGRFGNVKRTLQDLIHDISDAKYEAGWDAGYRAHKLDMESENDE